MTQGACVIATIHAARFIRERLDYLQTIAESRYRPQKSFLARNRFLWLLHREQRTNILSRLGLPCYLVMRMLHIQLVFTPLLLIGLPAYALGRKTLFYSLVLWSLQAAGATFTKLGQWASTRPDILPLDLCRVLSRLHTRAPSHGMNWNRYLIQKELGQTLEALFDQFDAVPIGSGTIAQVHRVRLAASQQMAALKIIHPHIRETIQHDLTLMSIAAELISCIPGMQWLSLSDEVRYFRSLMRKQLDLRYEAYTLDRFHRNFSTWRFVCVPVPAYPLVSPGILTETLVGGQSLSDFLSGPDPAGLQEADANTWHRAKEQIATLGLQSFLQMLLWDNFVHADLHPGNIFVRFVDGQGRVVYSDAIRSAEQVRRIQTHSLHPQLIYLDTGLVTELGAKDLQNFNDLVVSLVIRRDGYRAGKLMIERAPEPYRLLVRDPEGFCRELDLLVRPIFSDFGMELRSFAIAPVLHRVFELVREHHVRLDGSFTNLVMSLICVEGLGRQLAPDLNLLPFLAQGALQYLVTNVGRLHSAPQPSSASPNA